MTDDELDAIETLAKRTSPGPWSSVLGDEGVYIEDADDQVVARQLATEADGFFIISAQADVPMICAEVRRIWAENDRLRQDRYEAISVHTKEGLLASEWVARTGRAEALLRAVARLADKWRVSDDHGDMALRAMDRCAEELEAVLRVGK